MENLKNVLLDETEKMFVPSYLKSIQNLYYSCKNRISNFTKFRSIIEKLQNYATIISNFVPIIIQNVALYYHF